MTTLFSEYSIWFLPLCLLGAAAYAYWLYHKQDVPWNQNINAALSLLRFSWVLIIALLLLGWLFRQITNTAEKPVVAIALDNSQSIATLADTSRLRAMLGEMDDLATALREKEFEVVFYNLDQRQQPVQLSAASWNMPVSDLSAMLKRIQTEHEHRNLSSVVLISDGAYNQGNAPAFLPLKTTVFTLGVGDTLPRNDLAVKAAYHNRIAYLGNRFPIVAEISAAGFSGKQALLTLAKNGKVLTTKSVTFTGNDDLQQIELLTEADEKGTQHYELTIAPASGEFTTKNNTKHLYIEVLDDREKILLIAAAPHPDIKAIRATIEKNENYQLDVFIPGLTPQEQWKENEKYSLVIFHQIPSKSTIGTSLLQGMLVKNIPLLFVLANETNWQYVNELPLGLSLASPGLNPDKVTAVLNTNFQQFTLSDEHKTQISRYPPINAPFALYKVAPSAEVLMYQRVGSVVTNRPLLLLNEQNNRKIAAFIGDGLWQWRLQEYAGTQTHETFDEFFGKLFRYLAEQDDKRRFRVYTTAQEYTTSESVSFETEVYNKIYEKIYGQKINLNVTDEKGRTTNYTYINSADGMKYTVNNLPQGVYRFQASAMLDGKNENVAGEFIVKEVQLEALTTRADYSTLRQLSDATGGAFFQMNQSEQLATLLLRQEAPSVLRTTEETTDILYQKWIFFLVVLLATAEWFIRKFKGSY
jgi:hypothetical protein